MYIYIHTYIYIHIHTCIYIYICIYKSLAIPLPRSLSLFFSLSLSLSLSLSRSLALAFSRLRALSCTLSLAFCLSRPLSLSPSLFLSSSLEERLFSYDIVSALHTHKAMTHIVRYYHVYVYEFICLCKRQKFTCVHYHGEQFVILRSLQGGEDSQDVLSCRLFSAKEPLIIGLFCGKNLQR